MGGHPYQYMVEYEPDIQAALNKLRQKVFDSGDYFGSEMNPLTPMAAIEASDGTGTRSILDIMEISEEPGFCSASPLGHDELVAYFGTPKPTKAMLDQSDEFWEDIDRGMARYVILYQDDQPTHIYFAGYSFD